MSQLVGVIRYEFNMSIRRKGLWFAYLIIILFFSITISDRGLANLYSDGTPWQEAGQTVYLFNLLGPLIAGLLAADRMQRDQQLKVQELQASVPLNHSIYIVGKYVGVLLSVFLPMCLLVLGWSIFAVTMGAVGLGMIGGAVVGLIVITGPSFAFVVAFSLACPLVIPLRMYQVLFTGYWFWGNFLSDAMFPTVSGTLLNASGLYAQQAFFASGVGSNTLPLYTPLEAWLNIVVLGSIAAAVLFTLNQYLILKTE